MNMNEFDKYYIPKEYIAVIINKKLFKNSDKAVKIYEDFFIPLYALDDFELSTKKSPNSFIIYRKEVFNNVKNNHLNKSSRELSKIIGEMWNKMPYENKLPYLQKARELKIDHEYLYPQSKYMKVKNNMKKREYIKRKEMNNNLQYLNIKKIINNELIKGLFNNK